MFVNLLEMFVILMQRYDYFPERPSPAPIFSLTTLRHNPEIATKSATHHPNCRMIVHNCRRPSPLEKLVLLREKTTLFRENMTFIYSLLQC